MAIPVVTSNLVTISDAESITNWTANQLALDPDIFKEGANSVVCRLRADLATINYAPPGGVDVSNQHLRVWLTSTLTAYLDDMDNGGLEFYITDGVNTAYWNMVGGDTYFGGWVNFLIYSEATPARGVLPDTTVITDFGVRFNRVGAAVPKNADNTWVDYLRYGDGYYATGGTGGDPITISDIYDVDLANGYGILERDNNTYFGLGEIIIGNGATTTHFEMIDEVLIFSECNPNTGLYKIKGTGSGCNVLIQDTVIRSADMDEAGRFALDMSDVTLAAMSITRCSFTHAAASTFTAGQSVIQTTFNDCGQIDSSTSTFRNNIISNYVGTEGGAVLMPSSTANFNNLTIISAGTGHAILIDAPGTYSLDDMIFSGYAITDGSTGNEVIYNNSGGAVTLNASTVTGTISVRNGVGASTTVNSLPVPSTLLEYASYEGSVWIDPVDGSNGVDFPIGTPREPVKTIADAILIQQDKGLPKSLHVLNDLIFASGDALDGWSIFCEHTTTSVTMDVGSVISGCAFERLSVIGALQGETQMHDCELIDITGFYGEAHVCKIETGTVTCVTGQRAMFLSCYSGVAGQSTPFIDLSGGGELVIRDYSGGIQVNNKTSGDASIDLSSGQIIIDSTCTGGTIVCRGVGKLTDNSNGSSVEAEGMSAFDSANITLMRKILQNRNETNPITGIITVYDDDDSTVLFTANLWENVGASKLYGGRVINRRDRLT